MPYRMLIPVIMLIVIGMTACSDGGGEGKAVSVRPEAKILYSASSSPGFSQGIFVMDADGTNHTRLTAVDEGSHKNAAWSPDGKRIAYVSSRKGRLDGRHIQGPYQFIYVMNADGSDQTLLSPDGAYDESPSWSPDGKSIVFASQSANAGEPVHGRPTQLFVMGSDGSDRIRLTYNDGNDQRPDWSPDGQRIIFHSNVGMGETEGRKCCEWRGIYVINPDGSDQTPILTEDYLKAYSPSWSPDGKRIAYVAQGEPGGWDSDIYVMNADGSDPTLLIDDGAAWEMDDYGKVNMWQSGPTWSPDGKRIAYFRYTFPDRTITKNPRDHVFRADQLYIMNANGSGKALIASQWNAKRQKISWRK